MQRFRAFALASILACLVTQAEAVVAVESIEVRLFLAHTGTFSEPVAEGATLWNTVIGEAGLGEPSTSTLVKVTVSSSQPKTYDTKAKVQLTVRAKANGRKSILVKPLGLFGSDGRQYVGFWLPETGCEELQLEAEIRGSKTPVKRIIPFRCGE